MTDTPPIQPDDKCSDEMTDRIYSVENAELLGNRYLNHATFQADARAAVMEKMLELTGFPARSEAYQELERRAIAALRMRTQEDYLAFLQAEMRFDRFRRECQGDGAEPTVTEATIAERNKQA